MAIHGTNRSDDSRSVCRGLVRSSVALGWALAAIILAGPAAVRVCSAQNRQTWVEARNRLVDEDIAGAGVRNARVLEAMRKTPRHEFMPVSQRKYAYFDMAVAIGEGQTISPPFIVASMTEQLDPQPTDTVLEIGTGSGYQAAVLSGLVRDVYTIEIVTSLEQRAARTLHQLGYNNVHVKAGDGFLGWPEHAPFDKIIVTCSPEQVPEPLIAQLKEGGRMVIPFGERYQQNLYLIKKVGGKLVREALGPTLFVPMTGKAEANRQVHPDPLHPQVHNGDFEEVAGKPPLPVAWHYARQMEVVQGNDAPSGKSYATFKNFVAGRPSQALQGFAVDGRKVHQLDVSLFVRCQNVRPSSPNGLPGRVLLIFYDEKRVGVREAVVGAWDGTFGWRAEKHRVSVPIKAREAIIQIGLLGALGEISFDQIEVRAVTAAEAKKM